MRLHLLGVVLFVGCFLGEGQAAKLPKYTGFQVLTVSPVWKELSDHMSKLESRGEVDIMSINLAVKDGTMQLLVGPNNLPSVIADLEAFKAQFKIGKEDIAEILSKQAADKVQKLKSGEEESFHDDYHSYESMQERLNNLASKHADKSQVVSLDEFGVTHEKRSIKGIRITHDILNSTSSFAKPLIWLDGGIHAREWISPATMMYFVDVLLGEEEPERADKISSILDKYQVYIMPVINTDGYVYSCNGDVSKTQDSQCNRMWRKTVMVSGCNNNEAMWYGGCLFTVCYGVDPNRNWDIEFEARNGVDMNPCSDAYPGKDPWDQDCVNTVRKFLTSVQDKLKIYVTYHSYGLLFLKPYARATELPQHHEHHAKVGADWVSAVEAVHGVKYVATRISDIFGVISGSSLDWVYDVLKVVDSYGVELRPAFDGIYGFLLPADQIRPTGEEHIAGLLSMIDNIYQA